jgi:hypothetical protein
MLEQQMEKIKSCLNYLRSYLAENKEAKKQLYLEKLEKTLDLTNQFFLKYSKENITHTYQFHSDTSYYLSLTLGEKDSKWKIENSSNRGSIDSLTTQELAKYCWDNQMDIKRLIEYLFNYIRDFLGRKEQVVTAEKNKYNTEISCMDEAIKNLDDLVNLDISEDVKNK